MNLTAVSATGFNKHPQACKHLIARLAMCDRDETVLLDLDTVEREAANPGQFEPMYLKQVDFSTWVKRGVNEDGVVDPHAIRTTATSVPADQAIVIDARGYRVDLLAAALDHARAAWYPLEAWHPVFAIVCDDMHQLYVLDKLSTTFFCQPQVLTDTEVAAIVRKMSRISSVYRSLGVGAGRVHRIITGFLSRRINKSYSRFVFKSKKA